MKKQNYLFLIFAFLVSLSGCSEDEFVANHDLDNTVWRKEKTPIDDQRDHLEGLIFSGGYFQHVWLDKTTGGVMYVESSYKYSHDKVGERIFFFNSDKPDSKDKGISFKYGCIFWAGYRYYQKVI